MNGYEFQIWSAVEHNGHFQFNNARREIIHAHSTAEAMEKLELKPARTTEAPGLTITVSEEWIYSARCLGRVEYEVRTVYRK